MMVFQVRAFENFCVKSFRFVYEIRTGTVFFLFNSLRSMSDAFAVLETMSTHMLTWEASRHLSAKCEKSNLLFAVRWCVCNLRARISSLNCILAFICNSFGSVFALIHGATCWSDWIVCKYQKTFALMIVFRMQKKNTTFPLKSITMFTITKTNKYQQIRDTVKIVYISVQTSEWNKVWWNKINTQK